jgi:NO-binding membrane sensor protein with MHYT domain
MNNLGRTATKLIGAVAFVLGVSALVFVGYAAVLGGRELLLEPGALALLFLFSLGLLLVCAGTSLALQSNALAHGSLVPRWALVVAGGCLVLSIAGLVYFGGARSISGTTLLGGLGLYWLWSGLRRAA